METILVVEDDGTVQRALKRLFECEGYNVQVCGDGQSALDAVRAGTPTAIILDLGLPIISGKDVCREITRECNSVPIVVVSGRSDESDTILLLEMGADDYVTKPFSPRELLARVRAAIRRRRKQAWDHDNKLEFGVVTVDFGRMEAKVSGDSVELTAHEFKMLNLLSKNADRVVSRNEILTDVFGYAGYTQTRTMDNLILRLRQKLEKDPASPAHILTVRGLGYKFVR
jgi:DNA-binding response OmpR family regulator